MTAALKGRVERLERAGPLWRPCPACPLVKFITPADLDAGYDFHAERCAACGRPRSVMVRTSWRTWQRVGPV